MRRAISVNMAVLILLLSIPVGVQAAEAKIGIVDFQAVVEKSHSGQAFETDINAERQRMEAELTKDKEELEALKEKVEREAMVMSREAREEKEIEFRVKARNLQEKEKRYRGQLMGKQRQEVDNLRRVVLEIAQEIGKKEGFTMILSKVGVLYHDASIDLTDKVIQLLNKRPAAKEAQ